MALVLVTCGCSQEKKTLSEIRDAYESGEYRETIAYCRHAIRRNIVTAEVYDYYGRSLLALGRDYEAFRQFDEAVENDASWAPDIARELYRRGTMASRRSVKAQRLQKAVEYDASVDLSEQRFLVADGYYKSGDFESAARHYERALTEFPDTSVAPAAYYNMALSVIEIGAPVRARETLETLLDRFPTRTRTASS